MAPRRMYKRFSVALTRAEAASRAIHKLDCPYEAEALGESLASMQIDVECLIQDVKSIQSYYATDALVTPRTAALFERFARLATARAKQVAKSKK